MGTRKRRLLHKKRQAICGSTTSGSDSEAQHSNKRVLRPRALNQQLQHSDTYDADSEPSSCNDISVKESPLRRGRSSEKLGGGDDVFAFNEPENVRPGKRAERKSERCDSPSGRTSGGTNKTVAGVRNFHSSFKKDNSKSSPAALRVSFCDESINILDRDTFRSGDLSNYSERKILSSRPTTYETSTPAIGKNRPSPTESTSKVLRVSLSRLSDVASPIFNSRSVKRRHSGETKETNRASLSSGYGSMFKLDSSVESPIEGILGSEPKRQRVSAPFPISAKPAPFPISTKPAPFPISTKPAPYRPTKPVARLTAKEKKQLAVDRLKEQDERYLAELEELNDFELFVE